VEVVVKGLDANVLVRYIVQDDPEQSKLATQFIERECTLESPAFINGIVICKLVWVLETAYEYARQDISRVIEQILRTREFYIHDPELLWQSLWGYQHKGADFADHFIASINAHNGCKFTVTFDKKAAKAEHFRQLK
jgi:predicted nucleic-acid-binding protein